MLSTFHGVGSRFRSRISSICYAALEHHPKQGLASVFGSVSGLQRPQLEQCARVSLHCGVDITVRVSLALLEQCTLVSPHCRAGVSVGVFRATTPPDTTMYVSVPTLG